MSRRGKLLLVVAVVAVLAVGAVYATQLGADSESATADRGEPAAAVPGETVAVSRRTLTESESVNGTVGYGNAEPLPIDAQGIVTAAPSQDDILEPGDTALHIDNRPVVLAEGDVPMYRELREIQRSERDEAGDRIGLQEGPDVLQLQDYLLSAGFDEDGRLEADGSFGATTERAVKDWQRSIGRPATGRVDRSQLTFIDGPVRVDTPPAVGQPFTSLTVTTTAQTVTLDVAAAKESFFPPGGEVSIDTGDDTLSGTVTKSTRTTSPEGSTRYKIEITLDTDALITADTVEVTATKTIASDVLTVPVRALLALTDGGWALQVVGPAGVELTRVELGEVVDGIAEITGVAESTEVVVPS